MRFLLDTHIFLWLNVEPTKLSPALHLVCNDSANELFISLVSLWEIQIKQQLGKLKFDVSWQRMLELQQQGTMDWFYCPLNFNILLLHE